MSAFIGSIAGFLSSFIPELFLFLKDSRDKSHELKLIDRQIEALKVGHTSRLEEIEIQAAAQSDKYLYLSAVPSNIKWVDALSTLVRPLITYTFFLFYIGFKVAIFWQSGADLAVWNSEDQGIFCAVISFWFGQRSLRYRTGNNTGANGIGNGNWQHNGNGKFH